MVELETASQLQEQRLLIFEALAQSKLGIDTAVYVCKYEEIRP